MKFLGADMGEVLFALIVTVCVRGHCDSYVVDHDFTLRDCRKEAHRRFDDAPVVKWQCVPIDME